MRKYDETLIERIRNNQYIETIDSVEILMKPVPDDNRKNVLDPRVLEIIRKKREVFNHKKNGGYRLSSERNRPDKVSYDLCKNEIEVTEKLIRINNTHMINLYFYRHKTVDQKTPVMVFLHGGGMIAGNESFYSNQMKLVAELSGALVIFPEYRLAPECPFPGQIEDVTETINWVFNHAEELKIDINCFMVAGDSAGGSLTNACILNDTDGIIKKAFEIYPAADSIDPRKQLRYDWSYELYPVVDDQKEFAYERIDRIKNGMSIDENESLYLQGNTTTDDPLVSVNYATDSQLSKFPPITVVSAEYDYLRVGSDYFVKRLRNLDVPVKSVRYCGCDHGFMDALGIVVQSEELCMLMAEELSFRNNKK